MGPAAKAVVQVYFSVATLTKYVRTQKSLVCFAKALVPANGTAVVDVQCKVDDVEAWDLDVKRYVVWSGTYDLQVGLSSDDTNAFGKLSVDVVGNDAGVPTRPSFDI